MTVEKNGQLAWTFEEIDFDGAYEELRIMSKELEKEVDKLGNVVDVMRKFGFTCTNSFAYSDIWDLYESKYSEWKRVVEIRKLIYLYGWGFRL